ncbi:hypothetical protein Mycsm_00917 [Mycobacterium sp. JS623]|uniref:hypothetical protein n=1 Tax=Mycobacterium sp. JS623 TaxID=212767 RepID=UPI0002A5AEDA|nr:hypothetical protein [Mycobacterium sp. JS623]AGB21344.1 hypothetical protein Mycsm_00917 [Mycobacterium sp. JS623]
MTQTVDPTAPYALWEPAEVDLAAASLTGTSPDAMSTVERVAKVVAGMSVIGEARNALNAAGWTATITANRITVDDEVLAQFIPAKNGTFGLINARWIIYSIAGADPVWIVGTDAVSSSEPVADDKTGGLS